LARVATETLSKQEIWATAMSVVVQAVAPAASPCASAQSHPGPGYAGPEEACPDAGTRESFGAWQRRMGAATGSGGLEVGVNLERLGSI